MGCRTKTKITKIFKPNDDASLKKKTNKKNKRHFKYDVDANLNKQGITCRLNHEIFSLSLNMEFWPFLSISIGLMGQ